MRHFIIQSVNIWELFGPFSSIVFTIKKVRISTFPPCYICYSLSLFYFKNTLHCLLFQSTQLVNNASQILFISLVAYLFEIMLIYNLKTKVDCSKSKFQYFCCILCNWPKVLQLKLFILKFLCIKLSVWLYLETKAV